MASSDFSRVTKQFPVGACVDSNCYLEFNSENLSADVSCLSGSQKCEYDLSKIVFPYQLDFYKIKYGRDREYELFLNAFCKMDLPYDDCKSQRLCDAYPNHPECLAFSASAETFSFWIIFSFLILVIVAIAIYKKVTMKPGKIST